MNPVSMGGEKYIITAMRMTAGELLNLIAIAIAFSLLFSGLL